MGDIGVDHETSTRPQIGLVFRRVQVVSAESGRRDVHRDRVDDVEAHDCTGRRVDELEPAAVGAQPELLRHEVRRLVDVGFPDAQDCATIAVRVVLERPSTEVAQTVEARRKFERHADAGEVVETVRNNDHVGVDL